MELMKRFESSASGAASSSSASSHHHRCRRRPSRPQRRQSHGRCRRCVGQWGSAPGHCHILLPHPARERIHGQTGRASSAASSAAPSPLAPGGGALLHGFKCPWTIGSSTRGSAAVAGSVLASHLTKVLVGSPWVVGSASGPQLWWSWRRSWRRRRQPAPTPGRSRA